MSTRSFVIGVAIGVVLLVWIALRNRRAATSIDEGSVRSSDSSGAITSEVDRLMAYGQYEEAAKVVLRSLQEDPNDEVRIMKLLEVYFIAGNGTEFAASARFYRKALGEEEWQKVAQMGRQICPEESLFEHLDR